MLNKCSCVLCKKIFSSKGINTHIDRAHLKLTKYSSGNNGRYTELSERAIKLKKNKESEYYKTPILCKECKSALSFEQRNKKFCKSSCAAKVENNRRKIKGWTRSIESRKKVSESLTGKIYIPEVVIPQQCKCGEIFETTNKKTKKYCSKRCATKYTNEIRNLKAREARPALINYRAVCSFKFNLKDFPEEFDFTLIENYGWYKAKNRGNNLQGISRDHMISIRWGFDNNIDPKIISHPANCRLVRHGENVSKGVKNILTLDELLCRIATWDSKYNKNPLSTIVVQ